MAVATAEGSVRLLPRLEAAHEQWVLVYAVLLAAISNALVNTGLGWLDIRKISHVPLTGISVTHPSLITQAVGTSFFLPFFTVLITTLGVREELKKGNIVRLDPPDGRLWRLLFPPGLRARAARLGLASLLTVGPIAATVIALTAPHGCGRYQFLLVNSAVSVIFGAIATPVIAIAAMTDQPPSAVAAT
jgi:hypothetical protein